MPRRRTRGKRRATSGAWRVAWVPVQRLYSSESPAERREPSVPLRALPSLEWHG